MIFFIHIYILYRLHSWVVLSVVKGWMIFQYYVCYFDKIPFYQNLSIEKFNILIENKIHGKLGFDIDNIMRKSQFVGTRRTQVVHHIHFMVLVLVKIKKLHSITLSLTKCAFLVKKVPSSTSSPSNISAWIWTPCQTNFNPFFFFAILGHTHWKIKNRFTWALVL